ncbi:MAG TPA: lipid A export permease/ATP-binding protein MsbA [Gammaproteobacteria bacterium]|nr:lipid A export permease/ATP-binding protein MsbA [Gammaproteobacteria bacterium]
MASSKIASIKISNAWHLYLRLFKYVKRYWFALLTALLASSVYAGIDSWFVYFLEPLLNKGLIQKNQDFLKWAPLVVLLVFMMRGLASFFSNYNLASTSRNVITALRRDIFVHLQRLPANFYDHTTTGQVLSVILYSVEQVANASADVLTSAIQSSFFIVGLLIVMLSISWKLTLLYFIIMPSIAFIMRATSLRVRRLSLSIQNSMAELNHRAEENIEGYKVIRSFDGQAQEITKFEQALERNRSREMKVVAARAISVSSVQLVAAIALSFTLYVATLDIADSLLSTGGFVSMIAAMLALIKPMKDLTQMQNKLYRGLAGAQSAFELLDQPPEVDLGKQLLPRAVGKIVFSQVNFAYQNGAAVLHDINLTIEPGEVIALVGRSGSGKSTFVNLLPRFYTNYSGNIFLDGLPIQDYQLAELRRQFSLVSQNVVLFHDTVANNIAYGRLGETVAKAEIQAAAKAAHALSFIEQLPQGFDTLIGENGVLLSGGQRQRIAIARAILKNAPILILDEATSSLDTESERHIQSALNSLMRDRTTLVIAHRLSTIEHADKIIVFDQGKIIELGNHSALLEQNGYYAKLHYLQFQDQSLVEH